LYYYAWEFDYSRKIIVSNPDLPNFREIWPNKLPGVLSICDPLNPQNYIASATDLERLVNIFQVAYFNVWKPSVCPCQEGQKIYERMLYEAKIATVL